jgi:sec-independent protein translocase protein TatC
MLSNLLPKRKQKTTEEELSFFGHLEALRWHLFRSAIAIAVFSLIAFCYKEIIFDGIILAPKNPNFWTYRAFCWLSHKYNLDMCITSIPFTLVNNELSGQFTLHMWVAFIAGLVISFPYIFWELWCFIKPALQVKERKYTRGIVFFSTILFLMGVMFGYYILSPMSINFLGSYQVSAQIQNLISLDSYISTVTILTLATGVVFEMPIIIYFFSKIGLMTPSFMRKYRKHAFIIILIVAAIITPTPDITGQILVSIPLLLLYEISVFVSAAVLRNKLKAEK